MDMRHQLIGRSPLCIEKEVLIPYHHTFLQSQHPFSKPVLTIREVKLIEEFLGELARSIEDVL